MSELLNTYEYQQRLPFLSVSSACYLVFVSFTQYMFQFCLNTCITEVKLKFVTPFVEYKKATKLHSDWMFTHFKVSLL